MLDKLNFPEDLATLSNDELLTLAQEIRSRLLQIGDVCGGHLASNLGVVELTIVLHTLFDSPYDKFVWDTSHQTYVHKMLTGRLNKMNTIRQDNGLSGFAKITESDHDIFGAGHASTALSAALGIVEARDILKENYTVVSVIGDASLSGGMCFEALNNLQNLSTNFICILNDNDMSISPPVGSMADYITKIRTSNLYDKTKNTFESFMNKIPKIGEPLKRKIEKSFEHFRDILIDTKAGVIFEEFGFKYLGPIDGHDIPTLMAAIKYAKHYQGPIMIHIITQKGKGHLPAESDPVKYHGISPKVTSKVVPKKPLTYSKSFGKSIVELGKEDAEVVVITPAMTGGSCLDEFAKEFPDRFFDVGIAEEHAVTFAAGIARAQLKPVLAIYSTFLQRGYDQLVHDVCLQNLPVVFALDRAGLVGEDGPTHHGVLDYNFMLSVPNLTIFAPGSALDLDIMLKESVKLNCPVSIRYSKGAIPEIDQDRSLVRDPFKSEITFQSPGTLDRYDILIIGVGSMAVPAKEAAQHLYRKGLQVSSVNLRSVKPLDTVTLLPLIEKSEYILVVEEGQGIGGVFSFILNTFLHLDKPTHRWLQLAIPDKFIDHGKLKTLLQELNLTSSGIISFLESKIPEVVSVHS